MPEAKKKIRWSSAWAEARELVWAHRKRLALGAVLMLINQAMGLVLPASTKFLVDEVIVKGRTQLRLRYLTSHTHVRHRSRRRDRRSGRSRLLLAACFELVGPPVERQQQAVLLEDVGSDQAEILGDAIVERPWRARVASERERTELELTWSGRLPGTRASVAVDSGGETAVHGEFNGVLRRVIRRLGLAVASLKLDELPGNPSKAGRYSRRWCLCGYVNHRSAREERHRQKKCRDVSHR